MKSLWRDQKFVAQATFLFNSHPNNTESLVSATYMQLWGFTKWTVSHLSISTPPVDGFPIAAVAADFHLEEATIASINQPFAQDILTTKQTRSVPKISFKV